MNWVKKLYFKQVALAVILGLLIIGSVPAESMAYVVGSQTIASSSAREKDLDSIQRVLESRLISAKLKDAGLSADEIKSRLDKLSDAEVHSFAGQLNALYPGGDLGVVIALLVIVILVIVLLKLQNKKIVIQ